MSDSIRMRVNLATDPRVFRMAEELKIPQLFVIGLLWQVWSWADSHSLDGRSMNISGQFLDHITKVDGFSESLRRVGWLEGEDGKLTFPKFDKHSKKQESRTSDAIVVRQPDAREVEKAREARASSMTGMVSAGMHASCEFMAAYPKKSHAGQVPAAFDMAVEYLVTTKGMTLIEARRYLVSRAIDYAASPAGRAATPDYRPAPAKWLNDNRYEDGAEEWQRPNGIVKPEQKTRRQKQLEQFDWGMGN